MPVNGGDLVKAAGAEARDHPAYVPDRDQLVLAHADRYGRNEDRARIDAMQIDGFRQAEKGFGPMTRRIVAAAGQQIALDRKDESVRLARRRTGEARPELFAAAVGRHRERARQLQSVGGATAVDRQADDFALDAAPGGGERMRPVRRTQHEQPPNPLRVPLAERERHHAAVGAADDRAQRLDAEVIEEAQQELGLVVRGNAGERLRGPGAGGLATAAEVVEAEDAVMMGVERAMGSCDLRPPAE